MIEEREAVLSLLQAMNASDCAEALGLVPYYGVTRGRNTNSVVQVERVPSDWFEMGSVMPLALDKA